MTSFNHGIHRLTRVKGHRLQSIGPLKLMLNHCYGLQFGMMMTLQTNPWPMDIYLIYPKSL